MGYQITKRQLIHLGVAISKTKEKKKANEEAASLEDKIISRINSRLDNFEGIIMCLVLKLPNMSTPPIVTTPSSDIGSNSVNRPTYLAQNLNNVFSTTGILLSPHSMPPHTDKPPVILVDKLTC